MDIFIPTQSDLFPGFYCIPEFSNYVISKSGDVINIRNKYFLKGSTNPAGYFNYRLKRDDGYIFTWGRHRLLCRVFKYPGPEFDDLVVNHTNGIKGDDCLDNLEVVTQQENVNHAGSNGLTTKCCPISVRDVDTGEIQYFPSIVECARTFGLSKDAINYRVSSGEKFIFPERNNTDCRNLKIRGIFRKI